MYKLVVVTDQYAGDFEHEMYKSCIKGDQKYQISPYKSMIYEAFNYLLKLPTQKILTAP